MECENIHYQQFSDGSHSEGQQPNTDANPEVSPQESVLQSSRIPSVSVVQRVRIGDLGTVEIPKHPKPYVSEENQDEGEEDDTSTIDENYDIVSLTSSIEDQLT